VNFWKVIVATLSIFITGVVTGGLLVSYADSRAQKVHRQQLQREVREAARPPNQREIQSRPAPNAVPNRVLPRAVSLEFLQKLDTEVHLTSGQRERIEQIIAAGQARNKQVWDRVAPDIRRENMETQRRVREVLTEEQLVRYDELMKQARPNRSEPPPGSKPRQAPGAATPGPQ
jgi:hypothetical protein